jgi:hypothetical protein
MPMRKLGFVSFGAAVMAATLAVATPAIASPDAPPGGDTSTPATSAPPSTAQTGGTLGAEAAASAHGDKPGKSLVVADAQVLGPITQNARVDARDNGQSVEYHGKSVWFFDDTTLQNPFGFLSSTAATTSDLDASDGISLVSSNPFDESDTSTPTEFVPYSDAETQFQQQHASSDCTGSTDPYCGAVFAFWPGAVVADPARHRILVSYGKLCRGGLEGTPCASGFVGQALGGGIAEVDMRTHTVTRLTAQNQPAGLTSPEGEDDTLFSPPAEDWGGAGFVLQGRMLYAYGKCTLDGCGVASVPIREVQDLSAWRYYAGDTNGKPQWSTDPSDAIIAVQNGGAGGSVNWDDALHAYMHTYMPFLSQDVMYQTAPTPWGPWSDGAKLFSAPKTSGIEYAAFAHPEYSTDHGLTKYFTYYTSSTGDQMLVRVDFTRAS